MIHDCEATQERLVDLLFGELDGGRRGVALEELDGCPACRVQYQSLVETLQTFDRAAEASLPAEDFWPGYEERLRNRMAQEIQPNIWQTAAALSRPEYRLTFLEDEGLTRRLTREVRGVAHDAELTWPEFKRDPLGFTGRSVSAYSRAGWKFLSQRDVSLAVLASFVVIFGAVGLVVGLEQFRLSRAARASLNEELELIGMVPPEAEIPREQEQPDKGAAGMAKGKGGGMKPKQEKPGGGGGGGRQEALPASHGKLPQASLQPQILPPNPHPPAVTQPHLAVAPTIQADPTLFPPDTRPIPLGDPKSSSTATSSGTGTGGGIGTGTGTGVGPGDGSGFGPGRGMNTGGGDPNIGGGGPGGGGGGVDYNKTFNQKDVTRKAVILSKPEPGFTEEARKNNVTGIVR
ncbi:MAG TPA: zf-HC2 domain-containing protein, partial [Pyrinomonadaceae bacterium]|nr:zf-HC2 domain-containing protein [Pyrinomonadaceae bacterium]